MEIQLSYSGTGAAFKGTNAEGCELTLDGSPDLGGQGLGPRPMEMVLFGLAGCMAMDVLHIIRKARAELSQAEIKAKAVRVQSVPAVFEHIHLSFTMAGEGLNDKLAQRAIDLSLEKYCSVAHMLSPKVSISADFTLL